MIVIEGARVDDLKYLKEHGIDRNQVSQELSKIFSQMVYINGCAYTTDSQRLLLTPVQTSTPTRTTAISLSDQKHRKAAAHSNSTLSCSITGSTLTSPTTCA